ncbi:hypothetical protein [Pseudoxanthomonas beigongshangi]
MQVFDFKVFNLTFEVFQLISVRQVRQGKRVGERMPGRNAPLSHDHRLLAHGALAHQYLSLWGIAGFCRRPNAVNVHCGTRAYPSP